VTPEGLQRDGSCGDVFR